MLLMTYRKNQLLGISAAFLSQTSERLSLGSTRVMNKREMAFTMAELLVTSEDKKLGDLDPRDFMNEDICLRMMQAKSEQSRLIASKQSSLKKRVGKRVPTPRSFWQYRAREALRRETKDLSSKGQSQKVKKQTDQLSVILRHKFEVQRRRCKMCDAQLLTKYTRAWNNGSVDRRIPGVRGGQYTEDNIQILCVGCNLVKYWFSIPSATVLLGCLAAANFAHENSCLVGFDPDKPEVIEEGVLKSAVLPWCQDKVRNSHLVKKVVGKGWHFRDKHSTLVVSDLLTLVKRRWLGGGYVLDDAGIRAPLGLMSIDRIDSSGNYAVDNVRLLLTGLNLLKNDSQDDTNIIGYLDHLKANEMVRRQAIAASREGHHLPLHK
jgi:5-methylcytosine-specific restriction endonuclease McrA